MNESDWFAVSFIVLAIAVIVIMRSVSKRRMLKGRDFIALSEMYSQSVARLGVSYKIFERVFSLLGQSYGIDPRLLRPSDQLDKLYDYSSWDLGEGTDLLNQALNERFKISTFKRAPRTIVELVIEVDRAKNSDKGPVSN